MSTTDNVVCALPGCINILKPGQVPYGLGGYKDQYCSRNCCMQAYDLLKKNKPFRKIHLNGNAVSEGRKMEKPAEDFGNSGIIRRYCDRCNAPITICWKGRSGEYCSNQCLKETEKDDTTMTSANAATATAPAPDETSPISAGSSTKKASKKATKKAAPASKKAPATKKAPAKKAASAKVDASGVLHLTGTPCTMKGKRLIVFKLVKEGMTVADLKTAAIKKFDGDTSWNGRAATVLNLLVANGMVTVK